jgi:hypothetical protein
VTVNRKIVALMFDSHCGWRGGLMPPDVQLLDDTGPEPRTWTPVQTSIQRWAWPLHVEALDSIFALAGKSDVVLVQGGDLTQGNKHGEGAVSTRLADQYAIALAVLEPWYQRRNLKKVFLTEGTEVHEWGEGSAPVMIGAELSRRYPKVQTRVAKHWLLDVGGTPIDIAHHGPGQSKRIWLHNDELRRYARNILITEALAGRETPQVIARGHVHQGIEPERVRIPGHVCEAVVCPSVCGMSPYAQKVTQSQYILTCGLTAAEIVNGEVLKVHTFWQELDLRTREAV